MKPTMFAKNITKYIKTKILTVVRVVVLRGEAKQG